MCLVCLQFVERVSITTWLTTSTVQYVKSKSTRQNHLQMSGMWSITTLTKCLCFSTPIM